MDKQSLWIDQILDGVDEVPISGIPGAIVAYGHRAVPILTDDQCDVIMAAAELGEGRVFVFSHDAFYHEFLKLKNTKLAKLNQNIHNWLCHGGARNVECLDRKKSLPEITNATSVIFAWDGSDKKDETFYSDLLKYVNNGSGLVMGMCPWGYLQLKGGLLTGMPMYTILKEIGICYTESYYNGPNPLPTSTNNATHSHFALEIANTPSELSDSGINFLKNCLNAIPPDVKKYMSKELEAFSGKLCSKLKAPSPENPVNGREQLDLMMFLALCELKEGNQCFVAPGFDCFPGKCQTSCSSVTVEVELTPAKGAAIPSGYYLPAGEKATVTVVGTENVKEINKWQIRVGSHSDDISNHSEWKRWPNICKVQNLQSESITLFTPFGGLVYFQGPKKGESIKIKLENVMKSLCFDICNPECVQNWNPGQVDRVPWVDLMGKLITLTVPTESLGDTNPMEALEFWDSIVQAHFDLRGVDLGRQWFVPDVQPSVGYMHAGYPIVTHMDVVQPGNKHFVLNTKNLRKDGSWGHFHELGHNMQRDDWTFSGTIEVTCNIFTLHAMDVVCGIKPWIHPWLLDQVEEAKTFLQNPDFEKWNSPGVALFIYAQLARDFGWDAYKKVFRQYEQSPKIESSSEQIKQWIVRFSTAAERNLIPLFEFWSFPFLDECKPFVDYLIPYLPDDELTQYAEERTLSILQQWNNMDRKGAVVRM